MFDSQLVARPVKSGVSLAIQFTTAITLAVRDMNGTICDTILQSMYKFYAILTTQYVYVNVFG